MIVGISGLIGSGKNTVAEYLVAQHNFQQLSWAVSLKDAVSSIFGWDRNMLEGITEESRLWREQVDTWWSERLNIPDLTPRFILQHLGTDLMRDKFHDDIWVASLENKLRKSTNNIVISDCRFDNEIKTIKKLGGITIRVIRNPLPSWVDLCRTDHAAFKNKYSDIHSSEYTHTLLEYDYVVNNDSTLADLYVKINNLLEDHRVSK